MAKTRKLTVEVLGDVKGLRQSFGQAAKETQTLGQTVEGFAKKALLPATLALTALSAAAVKSVGAAADFEETVNKIGVVFGNASDQILKFSEGSAQALGQSRQQALDAAASFALFGKSAGLTGNELVGFSTELVTLATDLASINNADPSDVIQAIGSGLRGEAEPLRRFNILLDDFTLRQEAMRMGLIKTTKQALTPQQKVLAAHAVIMRQGSYAAGDFANTSDGLANQQRILKAELADVQREIGERLLPFALRMVDVFRDLARFVADNSGLFFGLGVAVATTSVAIIALNGAFKVYRAVALATDAINKLLDKSFTKLQTGMVGVGLVLGAAVTAYALVKGSKDKYKASTDDLVEALRLEGDAQRDAVEAVIQAEPQYRRLFSTTNRLGLSLDDISSAVKSSGPAYKQLIDRLKEARSTGAITNDEFMNVVGGLEMMRRNALSAAEAQRTLSGATQTAASSAEALNFAFYNSLGALGAFAKATGLDVPEATKKASSGVAKVRKDVEGFRDSLKTVRQSAQDNLSKAKDAFASFARDVSSSISSAFNFGAALQAADGGSFLKALNDQANKVADFSVLVNRLVAAGASEAVVQQVLGAGVEGGTVIANELLNTVGGVQTANALAARVQGLADSVGARAAGAFRQAGVDSANALVAGIESIVKSYTIKLRSKGLTPKQIQRLKERFAVEVDFNFSAARADVPALAAGGVVASPTLALIGEAGPEAVIPLDRMGDMGGGDTYVTVNVQGADPNAVVAALRKYLANTGPIPIRVTG